MFSACASAGGRAISGGLAPCPMNDGCDGKALDLESLDAIKLDTRLQAFDEWLWSDCEGGLRKGCKGVDELEPTLQVDCVEVIKAERRSLEEDPMLFPGSALFIDSDAQRNTGHPLRSSTHYTAVQRARLCNLAEAGGSVALLKIEHDVHLPAEKVVSSPWAPGDWNTGIEDQMNDRVTQMQEDMQKRSSVNSNEFAQSSRELKDWLKSNNFFSINSKRSRLLSFTYPLHVAAEKNNAEIVKILLLHQADPQQKDSKRCTALQVAEKKDKKGSHRKSVSALTVEF
jgi:hypothetical protein